MTHLDWLVTIQKIQQDDERHKKNTLKMKINHNKYKEKRKLTGVLGRMCNRLKGWKKRLYIAKKNGPINTQIHTKILSTPYKRPKKRE